MKNRIRKLLNDVKEEMENANGLKASMEEDMSDTFVLEFGELIKRIKKELGESQ